MLFSYICFLLYRCYIDDYIEETRRVVHEECGGPSAEGRVPSPGFALVLRCKFLSFYKVSTLQMMKFKM